MKLRSHWWWDLSTREFSELDMSRIVAVQPVGAVEQHGPHLPVRVDAAINAGIVARAVEQMPDDLPVLVLPMMPVGKSNEHHAYPGTLSFGYETLARMESLKPAFLKLGRTALVGVEAEGARRASIRSLVEFARDNGCTVIAEGIESAAQRDALAACGVPLGQGFYLGKPVPVERALADAATR